MLHNNAVCPRCGYRVITPCMTPRKEIVCAACLFKPDKTLVEPSTEKAA